MNKWDLTKIFSSEEEFKKKLQETKKLADKIEIYRGKLNNEKDLESYFLFDEEISKSILALYSYAAMTLDLNQKNQDSQSRSGLVMNTYMEIMSKQSFVSAEILKNDFNDIKKWAVKSTVIKEHLHSIEVMFHESEHIFEENIEKILNNDAKVAQGYINTYNMLSVADNFNVDITLNSGLKVTINESNFRGYLESTYEQKDREKIFNAVFKYYYDRKNTYAAIYNGICESNVANKKNRKYDSVLESYLYASNIPKEVYYTLVNTVRDSTDLLKRYYAIRKEYFGLDEVYTYDRFLKFASTDKTFTYDEVKSMFFDSVKNFEPEFVEKAHKVLEDGKVDVYPLDGKSTGAYSTGVYGIGTYILLNHTNTVNDAFTIVHEAGHSMHTMFSEETQPFATASYKIFVAEIASTFNESMFLDYLLENTTDKNFKLVLLQQAIDGLIGTFYRQTLFAELELRANQKVEDGEILTAQVLEGIVSDLYSEYYGLDLNKEVYKKELYAYVPHFYHSPLYVYQYATSYAASSQIFNDVKANKPGAFEKYLTMLKAGDSDYPIDIVKLAGVDLTKEEPYKAVVKRLELLLNELEETIKD